MYGKQCFSVIALFSVCSLHRQQKTFNSQRTHSLTGTPFSLEIEPLCMPCSHWLLLHGMHKGSICNGYIVCIKAQFLLTVNGIFVLSTYMVIN